MPKTVLVEDNERIDRPDFEVVASSGADFARETTSKLLSSPDGAGAWTIDGFDMESVNAGATLRVTRGRALFRRRRGNVIESGVLVGDGPTQKSINVSGTDHLGVWVRGEDSDENVQNRIFWDAASMAEHPVPIATRRASSWGLRIATAQPGGEWHRIGTVQVTAGVIVAITKTRKFYFEGDEGAAFGPTISDGFTSGGAPDPTALRTWGDGSVRGLLDRSVNRAENGISDQMTFNAAMRSQLDSILGAAQRWWEVPTEALDLKVSRNGDLTLTGNYKITGGLVVTGPVTVGGTTTLNGGLRVNGPSTFNNTVLINNVLTVTSTIDNTGGEIITSNITTTGTSNFAKSVAAVTNPDPDADSWLSLTNEDNNTNRHVAMYLLHGTGGARDGVALWTKRTNTGAADFTFNIASVQNSDAAIDKFQFLIAAGSLSMPGTLFALGGTFTGLVAAAGGLTTGGGLFTQGSTENIGGTANDPNVRFNVNANLLNVLGHATFKGDILNGASLGSGAIGSLTNPWNAVLLTTQIGGPAFAYGGLLIGPNNTPPDPSGNLVVQTKLKVGIIESLGLGFIAMGSASSPAELTITSDLPQGPLVLRQNVLGGFGNEHAMFTLRVPSLTGSPQVPISSSSASAGGKNGAIRVLVQTDTDPTGTAHWIRLYDSDT